MIETPPSEEAEPEETEIEEVTLNIQNSRLGVASQLEEE